MYLSLMWADTHLKDTKCWQHLHGHTRVMALRALWVPCMPYLLSCELRLPLMPHFHCTCRKQELGVVLDFEVGDSIAKLEVMGLLRQWKDEAGVTQLQVGRGVCEGGGCMRGAEHRLHR